MLVYCAVLLAAWLGAWLSTPLARRVALRYGIVDKPDVRKVHREATPYLGGAAVLTGLLTGVLALLCLCRNPAAAIAHLDPRLYAIFSGAIAMFALGLWDDVKRLRARHKLAGQLLIASAMWFAGIRIESIQLADGIGLDFGIFSFPITVLWIAGVANAINLIDGLDGLASGIAAISAAAIGFVAYQAGQGPTAAMLAVLLGALLGFLLHNHHPARIFLGDSGSLLIGFLLATCAVTSASKSTAFVSVGAPFLALGVPLLDMCFAMLRRAIERRGLFSPDRNHIHHRLMALGFGHARTVYILWAESAILTGVALALLYAGATNAQRLAVFALVLALHVMFFRATGAIRLRDSYRAFQDAARRVREVNNQKRDYDELELHFRTTRTIGEWWMAVELTASRLGFARLLLRLERRDGDYHDLTWSPSQREDRGSNGASSSDFESLHAKIPVRHRRSGHPLDLHVEVPVTSLESAGQRLTLFGRLLDKYSLAALPRATAASGKRHVASARQDHEGIGTERRERA